MSKNFAHHRTEVEVVVSGLLIAFHNSRIIAHGWTLDRTSTMSLL